MVKLTVLYRHPKDPAAFERYYAEVHMPLAAKVPGIRRMKLSRVVGTPDGSPPAYYRIGDLYFDDLARYQAVLMSPEGQAALADLANFATGGITAVVSEIR